MGPLARYQHEIDAGVLQADAEQRALIVQLDEIASELAKRAPWKPPANSLFKRWLQRSSSIKPAVPGLYLWGGVGRGKTHLCDLFFESLSFEDKTRLHFHRFMQRIHADLRELGQVENPISLVADSWAQQTRILLLDEIHVHDITDAMLLGGLLTELFARDVTLVTTSNIPPDDLYKDGLQRARFLPAIEQIKKHTHVQEIGGATDYRLRLLQTEDIYLIQTSQAGQAEKSVEKRMQAHFDRLKMGDEQRNTDIVINSRAVSIVARAGDLVWFDFDTLCNTPRSTSDYIEIATMFHTVMISNIPVLNDTCNDAARRLVNLIDEFYDRNVKIVVSADALPDALYTGKRLEFEFVRAASRLAEMQTTTYLSAQHRPVFL